ncbi:glycosyltransferase family 2 protein [Pseudonocardia asaccharolytica]|nr:glycosyltransferase family 2 protein [Pseudonocardia asaccharolytica]
MTATLDADSVEPGPSKPATRGEIGARRWPSIHSLSIVIPALNEEENIPRVIGTIPREEIAAEGCDLEIIIVDNASNDATAEVATAHGALVYLQPARGYGNAYHTGFAVARGDVIATGDADCTYPFDALPGLLDHMQAGRFDFLSTNRLGRANRNAMKRSHTVGNRVLTAANRGLFHVPFRDSQSGMWIFRRRIWRHLDVRSGGMPFSQEIKNEAYVKGFRCDEVPIEYRPRGGMVKLNAFRDGTRNVSQLAGHRMRARRQLVVVRRLADSIGDGLVPRPTGTTAVLRVDSS